MMWFSLVKEPTDTDYRGEIVIQMQPPLDELWLTNIVSYDQPPLFFLPVCHSLLQIIFLEYQMLFRTKNRAKIGWSAQKRKARIC